MDTRCSEDCLLPKDRIKGIRKLQGFSPQKHGFPPFLSSLHLSFYLQNPFSYDVDGMR